MGMGWVPLVKIREDENYVSYSYSRDSNVLDGTVIIKKTILIEKDGLISDFIEIKLSTTDTDDGFFAKKGGISLVSEVRRSDTLQFPEKRTFAWG